MLAQVAGNSAFRFKGNTLAAQTLCVWILPTTLNHYTAFMTNFMVDTVLVAEGPNKVESWCKLTLSLCLSEQAPIRQTQPALSGWERESRNRNNQDN